MNKETKISVVVPTFNSAPYLPETLDTILAQDVPGLEVVVVDDGSTDDTAQVIAPYQTRVRYLQEPPTGGPSHPRNVGVAASSGEFVAFFDSDDLMEPGALAKALAVFTDHPEADFVFANCRSVDERGAELQADYLADYHSFRTILQPTDDPDVFLLSGPRLYSELVRANFIMTCGVVVRRRAMEAAGPFDEELKNGDDRDMWMRLARTVNSFAFVDRVHFAYRKRGDSITRRNWRRMHSVIRVLEKHHELVEADADRRLIEERIHEARLTLAWGLRADGRLDEAAAAYREAARERFSPPALMGLLKTGILKLSRR